MRPHWRSPFLGLLMLAALCLAPAAAADDPPATPRVKIGDEIGHVVFKDIRFLSRSLDDFKQRKAFVLVFTNTTCPLVGRYWPTLSELEKQYRAAGVQFLAVNTGPDDSILDMASQAVRFGVEFPFVKDGTGSCVAQTGVGRTPEVVVLDGKKVIRYRGRIDDQYRLGGVRNAPTRHDLREVLDEVLAGREVSIPETPVDGCPITPRAPLDLSGPAPDYEQDVAPLIKKHCAGCHRPGTPAPFSLLTARQVAAQANAIEEVVADQRMPPWFASPEHGSFTNRRVLSPPERELIVRWVRSGAPTSAPSGGSPTASTTGDAPATEAEKAQASQESRGEEGSTEDWSMGKPDLIVRALRHKIPATGDINYKYRVLPYLFLADTWVQGVEIKPDNPRVLHHCNMGFIQLGKRFSESNFITGTVPGGEAMTLGDNMGVRIPAGSLLVVEIHYISTGKPENCRISVGFRYACEVIQKQLRFALLADYRFAIPPGAPAHLVRGSRVLDRDAIGVGMFAHMHLRGRDMTFLAHFPDRSEGARTETLLVIPNYSFDWQTPYRWQPGKVHFPKGTRLEAVAHYDNSDFNPYNPNPAATVRNGLQTRDEMLNGYVFYLDAHEQLGLTIDASTGRVVGREAGAEGR